MYSAFISALKHPDLYIPTLPTHFHGLIAGIDSVAEEKDV